MNNSDKQVRAWAKELRRLEGNKLRVMVFVAVGMNIATVIMGLRIMGVF